jgi:DNA-binding NarL/FixJ family response regulator
MSAKRRTAVALDPYPLWLDAVGGVLGRTGIDLAAKTTRSEEALAAIGAHHPDIFVTELGKAESELDGLKCLERATQLAPEMKSIVLSAERDPSRVKEALGAGAVAYVVKTAHPEDLAAVVRQVYDHSIYLPPLPASETPSTGRTFDVDPGLTRRELEILRLVSEGHSNGALARLLWVTEQTVKFHLSNVYRKLGVANRTEAARWAQLHGYVEDEPRLVA